MAGLKQRTRIHMTTGSPTVAESLEAVRAELSKGYPTIDLTVMSPAGFSNPQDRKATFTVANILYIEEVE